MARIFKRGNNWCIDYTIQGRQVRKRVSPSKQMAMMALKAVEGQIVKGEFGLLEEKRVKRADTCLR